MYQYWIDPTQLSLAAREYEDEYSEFARKGVAHCYSAIKLMETMRKACNHAISPAESREHVERGLRMTDNVTFKRNIDMIAQTTDVIKRRWEPCQHCGGGSRRCKITVQEVPFFLHLTEEEDGADDNTSSPDAYSEPPPRKSRREKGPEGGR